jgi:hypothetical protein
MELDMDRVVMREGVIVTPVQIDQNRHDLAKSRPGGRPEALALASVEQMSMVNRGKGLAVIIDIADIAMSCSSFIGTHLGCS